MCWPFVTPDILFHINALAIMQDLMDNEVSKIKTKWLAVGHFLL